MIFPFDRGYGMDNSNIFKIREMKGLINEFIELHKTTGCPTENVEIQMIIMLLSRCCEQPSNIVDFSLSQRVATCNFASSVFEKMGLTKFAESNHKLSKKLQTLWNSQDKNQ